MLNLKFTLTYTNGNTKNIVVTHVPNNSNGYIFFKDLNTSEESSISKHTFKKISKPFREKLVVKRIVPGEYKITFKGLCYEASKNDVTNEWVLHQKVNNISVWATTEESLKDCKFFIVNQNGL